MRSSWTSLRARSRGGPAFSTWWCHSWTCLAALRELDGQSLVTIMSGEIRRRHQLVRLGLHCEKLRAAMEDEAAVAWLLLRVLDRDRGEAV